MTKTRTYLLLALIAIFYVVIQGVNFISKPAVKIGVIDGRLADCPDKPNCVSSQAIDERHAIESLEFSGDPSMAWTALCSVVEKYPRATIIVKDDDYLHCEFRTAILRFVDDVEFLLNADKSRIEFRSASRIGHSDMGTNRKRMEGIRSKFVLAMQEHSD